MATPIIGSMTWRMSDNTSNNTAPCRRKGARAVVAQPSTVRTPDATPRDVTVEDLSHAGFAFTSTSAIPTGTILHVGLAGAGRASARVAWSDGDRHGCVFQPSLAPAQIQAAFSHATCPPVATLSTGGVAIDPSSSLQARPFGTWSRLRAIPLAARFALIALSGGLCWAGLAAGLHILK